MYKPLNIQTNFLDRLIRLLDPLSIPAYISNHTKLVNALEALKMPKGCTVLDLGSGVGNVLYTAKHILGSDNRYVGVEKNKIYAELSRGIDQTFKIYTQDIMESMDLIQEADLIYIYQPEPDEDKMLKMYEMVENNMKLGAILIRN